MTALRFSFILLALWSAAGAADRPNILLIVADDLGFSDLGSYGGEIRTPNLDRLAAEGMRFTQFYNCGDGVLSRAAMYTGLHPRQWLGGPERSLLRDNMITLGAVMRKAGYATVLSGIWQLGANAPDRPNDRGFGEFYGGLDGLGNHFNPARPDPKFQGGRSRPFAHNEHLITKFPDNFYSTDAFSDHAIEMIRRLTKLQEPFFLNLCYAAPHYPLQAPASDIARYHGKYRDGYEPLRERRFRRQLELGLFEAGATKPSPASLDYLYEREFEPWDKFDEKARERQEARMETYAAMVDRLDQGIGRVLATLDETGAARNTVVFFLSDNGGSGHFPVRTALMKARIAQSAFNVFNRGIPVGDGRGFEFVGPSWGWAQNTPFRRYKDWTYEGGICTPMIVRWPGVVAVGAITKKSGHVVDFMPTLLEIAGGEYPENINGQAIPAMEGRSLIPILRGGEPKPYRLPLGWELYGSRALRDGEWKLVRAAGIGVWELYNLATDRAETIDLASQQPDRVAALVAAWKNWAKLTEAPTR